MTIINWEIRNRTPVFKSLRRIKEITGIEVKSGFRDQRKFKPAPGSAGDKLRKKRQALGLSQQEMARKLGVSVDYIADVETERIRVKRE